MSFNNELFFNRTILGAGAGAGEGNVIGLACSQIAASHGQSYAEARTQADLDELVGQHPDNITNWVMDVNSEAFLKELSHCLFYMVWRITVSLRQHSSPLTTQNTANINKVFPLLLPI
jgi:hypothetical protein